MSFATWKVILAHNGNCEKDVKVRIGKAATIFGKSILILVVHHN